MGTTGGDQDFLVARTRIKSRTTPRCAVEFPHFNIRLWETEFRAQGLPGELDGRALQLPKKFGPETVSEQQPEEPVTDDVARLGV